MRIGTDIVEVSRIKRAITNWQNDFLQRVFTQQENIKINREDPNYERASGFWAAKEAMGKALGCGYRDGITFKDIEISHDELGCPHSFFPGESKRCLTTSSSRMPRSVFRIVRIMRLPLSYFINLIICEYYVSI